jgi:hypothetical protein
MARQQLNLLNAHFLPQALRYSARQGELAAVALLALTVLGAQALAWAAGQADTARLQAEAELTRLRPQLAATAAAAASAPLGELAQLQQLDAVQRRVRAALDAGAAGSREGHADYLMALARQASGSVWITGFAVSDDGQAIDLEGRMTDTSQLADYLRKLNAEPRFKGRPFAQLSLRGTDHNGATLPYTEFALRSTPATQANAGKP